MTNNAQGPGGNSELEKWLPTLQHAKDLGPVMMHRGWFRGEVDLWTLPVKNVANVAAIALKGRMKRRETWSKREEVSEGRYQTIVAKEPEPGHEWGGLVFAKVIEVGKRGSCTQCYPGRPGGIACPVCKGTGSSYLSPNDSESCGLCDAGMIVCPTCAGQGVTIEAVFEYVEEKIERFSSLILPDVPPELSYWLHAELSSKPELPECLVFRLDQMLQLAPYRGALRNFEPDFHGFRFGGGFERCRDGLKAIVGRPDVMQSEYTAYARAVLLVQFEGGQSGYDSVFVVGDDGELRGHCAKGVPHPKL